MQNSVGQRVHFTDLWRDSAIIKAVKEKYSTDMRISEDNPMLVSPFGEIFVQFVLVPDLGRFCYAAVFWHNNYLGQREDVYRVMLRHSEVPWVDSTTLPLDWNAMECKATVVTVGELIRRAIASVSNSTNTRIMAI
ncbi:MAG: hypothetical protein ACN6OP_21010 [Pseudomonadales bacterium]